AQIALDPRAMQRHGPIVPKVLDREWITEQRRTIDLHRVGWHVPPPAAAKLDAPWMLVRVHAPRLLPCASDRHPGSTCPAKVPKQLPPLTRPQFCIKLRFVARAEVGEARRRQLAHHALAQEGILHVQLFVQEGIEQANAVLAV